MGTMEDILNMLLDDATEFERHFYDAHDDGLDGLSIVDAPLDLTADTACDDLLAVEPARSMVDERGPSWMTVPDRVRAARRMRDPLLQVLDEQRAQWNARVAEEREEREETLRMIDAVFQPDRQAACSAHVTKSWQAAK